MKFKKLIVVMALAFPTVSALACASCGCSLNTDIGTQGMGINPGWSVDLRYDTLNQNKLRLGNRSIAQSAAAATGNEVENYTQNNYLTASLDYNNGESWGVSAVLPYIIRNHSTFGAFSGGVTPPEQGDGAYSSKTSGVGDIKIIGRYFGFAEQKNWGIQYGVKLPTGARNQSGALSAGGQTIIDPGLQAGSGSTDLIVGAYQFGFINDSENWGYFSQLQYQAAVMVQSVPTNVPNPDGVYGGTYRPGNSMNLNLGINYQGFERWVPTLQLNVLNKKVDSGTAADTYATGGTLAYLTPGLLYRLTEKTQIYANVQLPIYQNVNGIQIVPSYIFSTGVRVQF